MLEQHLGEPGSEVGVVRIHRDRLGAGSRLDRAIDDGAVEDGYLDAGLALEQIEDLVEVPARHQAHLSVLAAVLLVEDGQIEEGSVPVEADFDALAGVLMGEGAARLIHALDIAEIRHFVNGLLSFLSRLWTYRRSKNVLIRY